MTDTSNLPTSGKYLCYTVLYTMVMKRKINIKKPVVRGKLVDADRIKDLLNWYSGDLTTKGAYAKIRKHMKKKYDADASLAASDMPTRFGHICALLDDKKVKLPEDIQKFYDEQVEIILQKIKDNPPPVREKPKVNIQDRLRQKADIAIAELEEQVDDMFMSDFQEKPSPLPILVKYQLKPMHLKFVVEWANEAMEDWVEALEPEDPQIKEGYAHTTKTKKKRMIAYYESVKECCEKIKSLTKKKSSVKIKIR